MQGVPQVTSSLDPERLAQDAEVLSAAAYELGAELARAGKTSQQVADATQNSGDVFQMQKYPITLAMNFGKFCRQRNKLNVKALVDPGAYDHLVDKNGQGHHRDDGIPGDPLWLAKTRYWLDLGAHMEGHASVQRYGVALDACGHRGRGDADAVCRSSAARHGMAVRSDLTR